MTTQFYPNVKFGTKSLILYGGSFSPFHNSHLKVLDDLYKLNQQGQYILVPVSDWYKKDRLIKGQNEEGKYHRIKMCELALHEFNKSGNMTVSDIAFTYQDGYCDGKIIEYYKSQYEQSEIYYIMGQDVYDKLSTWQPEDRKLLSTINLIIYPRTDDISSTSIKKIYDQTGKISHLPPSVEHYILKYKLLDQHH